MYANLYHAVSRMLRTNQRRTFRLKDFENQFAVICYCSFFFLAGKYFSPVGDGPNVDVMPQTDTSDSGPFD